MTKNNGKTIINVFGREEPLINDNVLEREKPRIGRCFARHVRRFLRYNARNVRNRTISLKKRIIVNEQHQRFKIKGLRMNSTTRYKTYRVHISNMPRCSCQDFERYRSCEHMIYVYLKVLRNNRYIYQRGLSDEDLRRLFGN
ncbi:6388_t:CDS:2 [Funneliformis mosseae]|uniref:6388_t:CDS:1 n=1 Tax=Funneliformis mosseae TaxID=27381 RepID=A0A9N9EN12_FUNMO|nr:6388_t:CDS:2 [Funneliformis mosseae]